MREVYTLGSGALMCPPLRGRRMAQAPKQASTTKTPPAKPKAPARSLPVKAVQEIVVDDPLGVTASYATMTSVMSTAHAVRLSFGEASPKGNRFHTAVALDYGAAKDLLNGLKNAVARYEKGEAKHMMAKRVDG